ncbi:hypothetical protein HDU97_010450 [Phlyctochytrium planicorne]|nr:hypothetical protein HDU97_010450 [Phlyctochytrium planicorne]
MNPFDNVATSGSIFINTITSFPEPFLRVTIKDDFLKVLGLSGTVKDNTLNFGVGFVKFNNVEIVGRELRLMTSA